MEKIFFQPQWERTKAHDYSRAMLVQLVSPVDLGCRTRKNEWSIIASELPVDQLARQRPPAPAENA